MAASLNGIEDGEKIDAKLFFIYLQKHIAVNRAGDGRFLCLHGKRPSKSRDEQKEDVHHCRDICFFPVSDAGDRMDLCPHNFRALHCFSEDDTLDRFSSSGLHRWQNACGGNPGSGGSTGGNPTVAQRAAHAGDRHIH